MATTNKSNHTQTTKAKPASKSVLRKPEIIADPESLRRLKIWLGLIIAAFAFVLYAQSISFSYTLDDGTVIRENKVTRKGISAIPTIIKNGYWYGFNDSHDAAYRPTSLVMFAIEYQIFDDNPHVSHLINILLYALSCWLLFQLLCKLFENQNLLFPFICGLLYVAHPIHTEVVDSIKSRDEILCFLFALLTISSVLKYVSKNSIVYLVVALVCFFLSLLSKESGTSYLIIIPLLVYVFTKTDLKKIMLVFGTLLGVAAIYIFIRLQILDSVTTSRTLLPIDNTLMDAKSWISREATAFYIMLRYVLILIMPHPLSYDYSFSQIKIQTLSDLPALIGIAFNFALGIYAIINIRKKSVIAFAILFYLLLLAPVSNVFVIIGSTMAERFMYAPSLGFCILVTLLLIKITKTEAIKSRFNTIGQFFSVNTTIFVFVFIIVGLYSIKTYSRSKDWKDNIALFGADVETADNSARSHYNWGSAILLNKYPDEKNVERKKVLLDQAIMEFTKAVNIFKIYPDAYLNLGLCYMDKEMNKEAIQYYEMARQLYPKPNPKVYNNLGLVYGKTGQFKEALAILDSALKIENDFSEAHNNRGNALAGLNRFEEAIPEFEKAIEQNKKYAEAYRNLGSTYGNIKQYEKALGYFEKAFNLDSTDAQTVAFMGMTYNLMGDTVKAKPFLEKANRIHESQQK